MKGFNYEGLINQLFSIIERSLNEMLSFKETKDLKNNVCIVITKVFVELSSTSIHFFNLPILT